MKSNADIPRQPLWETHMRTPSADGRAPGIDGSMWLWREVPMGAVLDAKSTSDALKVGTPLALAFEELSQLSSARGLNRRMVRKGYREFQLLLTNYPKWYEAPKDSPIAGYLNSSYRDMSVTDRRVLLGVRLTPTTGDGSVSSFIESARQTLFEGGAPESDYDRDFEVVSSALSRAGLTTPSPDSLRAGNAWWNHGLTSDTPVLEHAEHLHYFRSMSAAETAQREGLVDCDPWLDIPDHMATTFCTVAGFDIGYTDVADSSVWWVPELVKAGARVISVRGFVEPPTITRQELKSQRRRVRNDIMEAAEKGKTDQASREEAEAELDSIERAYDVNKSAMPATLIDTSIIVGFAGVHKDISRLSPPTLELWPLANRQMAAWHETMMCSNVRANPQLHDLPATTVAYSGVPNLSIVGDEAGALVGFTEDGQPVYLSATAASFGDASPLCLGAAATGSGKRISLDTVIPTPSGQTTMGQLEVGEAVFGRDGRPCKVTALSPIEENPQAYKVTLSDGQSFLADAEHQWVVSDYTSRQYAQWRTRQTKKNAPDRAATLERDNADADTLSAMAAGAARTRVTVTALLRYLHGNGFTRWTLNSQTYVAHMLDFVDVPRDDSEYRRTYDLPTALAGLAVRLRQSREFLSNDRASTERRMTTFEMLSEGVKVPVGDRAVNNFAIAVAAPVELPDADLSIEPYALGAWLGDGSSSDGAIGASALVLDDTGRSDQSYMLERFASYGAHTLVLIGKPSETKFGTYGLTTLLREAGVLNNKHIPMAYLRGSVRQRLELLQGLMDTDGCIDRDGRASFVQKNPELFTQVVALIRSLGIKVNISETDTSYPVGEERKVTGRILRASFRTARPVVTLPRKAARLPVRDSPKSRQVYITSITPAEPVPMRCITVDSPDHTYLIGDFVPNSNTVLLQWLAFQHSMMGHPVVIIDPKEKSDLRTTVLLSGGRVVSFDDFLSSDGGLDPLTLYPTPQMGIPLATSMLFRVNPWGDDRRRTYEADIAAALRYGIEHGALATGQALKIAHEAGIVSDEVVSDVFKVAETFPMFRATFGMQPNPNPLSVHNGTTLFMRGNSDLVLPPAGSNLAASDMDMSMRLTINLLRMLVRGSISALAGRGGVLHMDEAWTIERSAPDELNEIGRLARSLNVLPIPWTQTPSGPVKLGLSGYISRGLIGHISDKAEAESALELFTASESDALSHITAPENLSGGHGLNWQSLKALRQNKKVVRGSVFYYSDLKQRFAPVEVRLPQEFLDMASTNPEDVRHRLEQQQAG